MDFALLQVDMPDIIIPNGGNASQAMNFQNDFFDAEAIYVQAPHVIDAGTYTWEGSIDGVSNWGTIQDATGTAIKAPSAIDIIMIYNGVLTALRFFRLKSSVNVTADRTYKITKSYRA